MHSEYWTLELELFKTVFQALAKGRLTPRAQQDSDAAFTSYRLFTWPGRDSHGFATRMNLHTFKDLVNAKKSSLVNDLDEGDEEKEVGVLRKPVDGEEEEGDDKVC
jgi:hypothetical protein